MLAFWNGGTPRIVNPRRVVLPNGDVVMNAVADPENDLYDLMRIGPKSGKFEIQLVDTFAKAGVTITATRTVGYLPLEEIKAKRIALAKADIQALLAPDDWMSLREREEPGRPMNVDVKTYRADLRQASDNFDTTINDAVNEAAAIAVELVLPTDPRETP